MRAAAHEYFKLMLPRWWCLSLGAAAGVVGLLADMEGITMPLPSWIWWVLALVALVVAQFWAFATLHKEVTSRRSRPRADMYLHKIFDRLHEAASLNHPQEDPIKNALNLIMERAATGEITIFGTATDPKEGNGPAVPIDPVYWRKNYVTLYGKIYSGLTDWQRERQIRTEGEGETYYALRTDSSQVLLCWPQEKRLKLQLPFRRETANVK